MKKRYKILIASALLLTVIGLSCGLFFGLNNNQEIAHNPNEGGEGPETPEDPNNPSGPNDPGEPTDPTDPSEPNNPGEPDNPGEPEEPSDPENPGEPENPSEPTDPTDPSDPTIPDQPEDPEEPEDPNQPENPDYDFPPSTGENENNMGSGNEGVGDEPENPDESVLYFDVLKNIKVDNGILSFDAVSDAYNGYEIKVNNGYIINFKENSFDLKTLDNLIDINVILVRVKSTSEKYMSSYSLIYYPVNADEDLLKEFSDLVDSIQSGDDLANAKNKYNEIIQNEDNEYHYLFKDSVENLIQKDSEYFLNLTKESLDDSAKKEEAKEYYSTLLDANNDIVREALKISFATNISFDHYYDSESNIHYFVYFNGVNLFNENILVDEKFSLNKEVEIVKHNEISEIITNESITLTYNDKTYNLSYVEPLKQSIRINNRTNSIFDITNLPSNTTSIEVGLYESFNGFDLKITSFIIENPANNPSFSINKLREIMLDKYENQVKELTIKVKAFVNGSETFVSQESLLQTTVDVVKPKLLTFKDLNISEPTFPENNSSCEIDYKREVLTTNPDQNEVEYLEITLVDASNTDKVYASFLHATNIDRWIKEDEVINALNSSTSLVKDDSSSIEIKAKIRLIAKDGSLFENSDYTLTSNSKTYHYKEVIA